MIFVDKNADSASLRVLVFCDAFGASQQIHLFRPLRRLRESGEVSLAVIQESNLAGADVITSVIDFIRAFNPTVVIFSRFGWLYAPVLLTKIRAIGFPLIAHLDDYLLDVPPELGVEKMRHHMNPSRLAAVRTSLTSADLIYVSTVPLAKRLARDGFSAPIVASTLQSCVDSHEIREFNSVENRGVCIGYQGTRSHEADLRMIVPALIAIMAKHMNVRFEVFGTVPFPPELQTYSARIRIIPAEGDYSRFLERLSSLGWHVGVAPLTPTEFNSYRTYTKWTEYTAAGIPTLASDLEPYREIVGDSCGLLVNQGGWETALDTAVRSISSRRQWVCAGQLKLRLDLTLLAQERQLLGILEQARAKSRF